MYVELVCLSFLQAHRRGLKYPLFTFMHAAWWSPQWWQGNNSAGYECTLEERESVVEYSLAVLLYEYIANFSDVAETGLVSQEQKTKIIINSLLIHIKVV